MNSANNPSETQITCQCGYNLTGAVIGGTCPECGAAVEDALRSRAVGPPLPRVSYVMPIIITLLCCVIGGVITIVYTSKANTAADLGDQVAYQAAKSARDGWTYASIGLSVIVTAMMLLAG